MKLTFLGTGTSQGVPVIGCQCEVCRSADERDRRLRTSAMIEMNGVRIVIDAGPDFRQQMLREGVRQIDAILLTHGHTDHVAGLDDVRAFNFVDYPAIHRVDIYAAPYTTQTVLKVYDYAFAQNKYRGVPEIDLHTIDLSHPFEVSGIDIIPISGKHSRFDVTGYRIGKLGYLTDFKEIAEPEVEKLKGVEVLVVNALRFEPHDSHFCVAEALSLIEKIAPRRAYLTHMSHEIGLYDKASSQLPEGVEFAYDGLQVYI
jgi:phosphoribosyl 1,2-cyclic phosphate phosphodiesterase